METEITMNKLVYLNRGDTLDFPFLINEGNDLEPSPYILQDGEFLYFGVMEPNQPFEVALIRKKYDKDNQNEEGYINIHLDVDDTILLLPGTYYYEIKLQRGNEVKTLVSKRKFIIL